MTKRSAFTLIACIAALLGSVATLGIAQDRGGARKPEPKHGPSVQLGPRPYFLIDDMDEGELKRALQRCENDPLEPTEFSIGHRGAGASIPRAHEGVVHRRRAYGRRHHRVRRDLHAGPQAGLSPRAVRSAHDHEHPRGSGARGEVHAAVRAGRPDDGHSGLGQVLHTSDITLAEFKTLCGKMDAFNPNGTTVAQYMAGTPDFSRRSLFDLRHRAQPRREHPADQEPRREVHTRTQGARSPDAVRRRLHAAEVRAADK